MGSKRFVICGKNTDNHIKNSAGYKHPEKQEQPSLFITKFPDEELTADEFIVRFKDVREHDGRKRYCVPEYENFRIDFPDEVVKHLESLKSSYSGKALFDIWENIRKDSGLDIGYTSTNSSPGVTVNLVKMLNNTDIFYKNLKNIKIIAKLAVNKKGLPKDGGFLDYDPFCSDDVESRSGGRGMLARVIDKLSSDINVIVEGVAGSGKSHLLGSLRRVFYKQEESKITYWVAPEENEKDTGDERNSKAQQLEFKKSDGFLPLYGENGERIEVVVFHPSTSYEEFVSGIRPNFMKKEGEGGFVSQEGVFVEMCNRAAANPDKNFLLFIDEINRANTARVFGDLMLVIEDSKRVDFSKIDGDAQGESSENSAERGESGVKPQIIDLSTGEPLKVQGEEKGEKIKKGCRYGALFSAQATVPSDEDNKPTEYVRLQTSIYKTVEGEDEPIEFNKLVVPVNLHVLGTMNTTDRSVGTIDLALRRRFHWVTQEPMSDKKELIDALELSGDKDKSVDLVAGWFMDANTVLKTEVGPDARLGHAYFFGKDGDAKAIAEALIAQLLEIIYTFNIKEDVLEKIGLPKLKAYNDKKLDYEGKGLGRRPIVKEDKGKSPTVDGGSDSENEVSDNTDSENSQGDQ